MSMAPALRAANSRSHASANARDLKPRLVFLRRAPCQSRYQHCTVHVPRSGSLVTAIALRPSVFGSVNRRCSRYDSLTLPGMVMFPAAAISPLSRPMSL